MKKSILKTIVVVSLIVIFLDQLSKFLVTTVVSQSIGNNNFGIEIFYNKGIAFGISSGNGKNVMLSIIALSIIIWFLKNQINRLDKKTAIAVSLMLGGGISNLIDRLFRNGVVDFVKIWFIPNFNLADLCICIGWILIIIFLIIYGKEPIRKN